MVQISIPDALYRQLQTTAQERGVSIETYIQQTLEEAGNAAVSLQSQEERNLFDTIDQLAQQNGAIPSEEWSKLVSEMRD
jgi:3-dehydroquinate dehydratase